MSLWDRTPATLTSFTPLSSEVQASGNFITRWLRKGKDESDQSSDGGSSKGPSRETSVDRNQSREQSLERRISQRSSSKASLIDGSQSEQLSETESSHSESSKKLTDTSLERSDSVEVSKRTLRSVITRLSAILERRTATPQVYRDSDFKQYWMPDSSCRECYDCGDKFTTFRRRHHCRICGQIFCNACCNQELPGKIIGYKGSIRVCDYCCQVAQRFAQKADPASDPRVTKEVLRKAYSEADPEVGLKRRSTIELMGQLRLRSPGDLETSGSSESVAPFDLTPQAEFVSMDMTERKMLTQDSAELRNLWNLMLDPARGVEFQNYRYRLKTYQRCIAGNRLVDWLLRQDKVKNRNQAVAIGQALIDGVLLEPILNVTTPFRDDFTLYRPAELPLLEPQTPQQEVPEETIPEDSAPLWFQEIQTSTEETVTLVEEHFLQSQEILPGKTGTTEQKIMEELKVPSTGVTDQFDEPLQQQITIGSDDLTDPLFSEGVPAVEKSIEESGTAAAWRTLNIFSDDKMEKNVFDTLQHEHHDHLTALTKQLLSEENLPSGWADIIIATVDRVSLFVKPDIKNSSDDMDIRHYVHVKKIPGGKREQTGYVHGVIFKKNVAHKKMSQQLSNPRTLLMNGSIEYQRVENKMSSLQPQILQEEEFLRKGIAKIAALKPKPDILIVEKSVSRLAQDFLLKNGITLIYNVKMSVMERLSRFLQADIVPSIDSLVTMPALGFCHTFSVTSFVLPSGENKTMLCFDGCATHLGCSITLRGGSLSELKKVKKVMNFMIYASYHSRLEISFCMDEYLMPPPRIEEIDFDLDSIKYNRKHETTGNQLAVITGNSKNDRSRNSGQLGVSGNGDCEIKDSDKIKLVGKSCTNTRSSQSSNRLDVMEKDLIAMEKDIMAKDGNKTAEIDTETSKGDFLETKSDFEQNIRETDSDKNGKALTVGTKRLEISHNNKTEVREVSEGTEVFPTFSEVIQNRQEVDAFADSQHIIGDTAVDVKVSVDSDDKTRIISDPSEIIVEKHTKISKMTEGDLPNKGDALVKTEKTKHSAPKLELVIKQPCDKEEIQFSESLILRSVSSPNFEKPFPFASDDLNSRTVQSKQVEKLKNLVVERTKPSLKGCLSESVIKCDPSDKLNTSKSDRSPSLRRKVESTCLTDQSDPLQSYQKSQDDSIFHSSLEMEEQLQKNRFKLRKSLESVILSISPYIHYELPYLETEQGSRCELRKYFPEEIYWSHHFSPKTNSSSNKPKYIEGESGRKTDQTSNIVISEAHELIRCKLNQPATDPSIQTLIAKFRAYGGRINVLGPQNGNSLLFPPLSGQKGNQYKGKENQASKALLTEKIIKNSETKDTGLFWERKTDCLDPVRHQRIAVLFSSFSYASENHPSPCVYPWVVTMEFYGRNDITLGGFLERFCFRPSYECPSDTCNTPMVDHIRRFAHGTGSISVVLKKLNHQIQNGQDNILMWSWCYKCKQVTPVTAMSTDTWNMSFAKYLEIRFHGSVFQRRASAEPCGHSLHHDHFQYFGFRDTVASFKYSPIKIKEIKVPPFEICCVKMVDSIHLYRLFEVNKQLLHQATDMYSCLLDGMTKMKAESSCETLAKTISSYITQQQSEKTRLRELAHGIREKLHLLKQEPDKKIIFNKDQYKMYTEVEDGMVMLKRMMVESVTNWNNRIQELYVQQTKKAKQGSQKKDKDKEAGTQDKDTGTPSSFTQGDEEVKSVKTLEGDLSPTSLSEKDDFLSLVGSDISSRRPSECTSVQSYIMPPIDFEKSAEDLEGIMIPPLSPPDDSVTIVTTEPGTVATTEPVAIPHSSEIKEKAEVHQGVKDKSEVSQGEEKLTVQEPIPRRSPQEDQTDGQTTDKLSSIKKTLISTIWQGPVAFQQQMPFDAYEHHLLPPCKGVPVVVYDHEPSSIIAYSLSCHDYHTKLQEIQTSFASQRETTQGPSSSGKALKLDQEPAMERSSKHEEEPGLARRPSSGKLSFFRGSNREVATISRPEVIDTVRYIPKLDSQLLESPCAEEDYAFYTSNTTDSGDKSKESVNSHIELQFSDGVARFYCKVYFAEQFRQLRKQVLPDGEDVFIRSLSRCRTWEAKGGKSGSSFRKTIDDRFILKQMSSMEVDSFEKFGPQYFQFIYQSDKQQRPSALAKIVGVYRIGFRNQQTNNAMKQDLLVVENLFYNRNISQTYDLKGSERNRLVKTKSKRGEELVLLDENFLRASVDSPLYILPHSKTMLTLAISHDSQFLSSNLVMDYSLLVGVDEEKKELVVGIIDYIRTFTWDKKLETILKSNFGGQGKMPTVVSPEVYRNRFLDMMGKYFLSVPDQWSGLGRDVDN